LILTVGVLSKTPEELSIPGAKMVKYHVPLCLGKCWNWHFTIPHLDTTLLATSVHSTIMAYIISWQYAEIVLAVAVAVALYYAGKYAVFAQSL